VIRNFGGPGIAITGGSGSNQVQSNIIGLDPAGNDQGNGGGGVVIVGGSANNVIGGSGTAGNVISGNGGFGVNIVASTGNSILGNFVGTDLSGTMDRGNDDGGIRIQGFAIGTSIGSVEGPTAGAFNIIAFNGDAENEHGVTVLSDSGGVAIRGNAIHGNQRLGIDLEGASAGVTANDLDDPDSGANNLQNFPVLTKAYTSAAGTIVQGSLNSEASKTYAIDIFSSPGCDLSGHGEGKAYLGSVNVTTPGSPPFTAAFNVNLPSPTALNSRITATATDSSGNTSEFSVCVSADATPLCAGSLATHVGTGAGETIDGRSVVDVIVGLGGNDTLNGMEDNDKLCGGAGNDTLNGADGDDNLQGEDGADTLIPGSGTDTASGGPATDTVSYAGSTAVTVNLGTGANNQNDTLSSIQNATGSSANDTITGNSANNILVGLEGNDTLNGVGGNDNLVGGDGADTLITGGGTDIAIGGTGSDTLSYPGNSALVINLGTGINNKSDTFGSIENVKGTKVGDTITGSNANNTLEGLNGRDTLSGGIGDDTLLGGIGPDAMSGGAGTDTCNGGPDLDTAATTCESTPNVP
jgi:Ca2+-binding RTX toxin-like protein